jgi:hypothetical protein
MKTKEYDFNIYVIDGVLSLSAYQLEIASNGQRQLRTDNYITKYYPMTEENYEEITYLLDSEDWIDELSNWEEYDAWGYNEHLTEGEVPASITEWVNSLPEYERLDLR